MGLPNGMLGLARSLRAIKQMTKTSNVPKSQDESRAEEIVVIAALDG